MHKALLSAINATSYKHQQLTAKSQSQTNGSSSGSDVDSAESLTGWMVKFVVGALFSKYLEHIRGCIQKFPYWPLGTRTANVTALCQ
jgi:hypothetical protein